MSENPPAFPAGWPEAGYEPSYGMTLRDWFAGTAPTPADDDVELQERLDRNRNPHNDSHKPRIRSRAEIIASLRYAYADAMLAERAK